jgi:hypothetical protein
MFVSRMEVRRNAVALRDIEAHGEQFRLRRITLHDSHARASRKYCWSWAPLFAGALCARHLEWKQSKNHEYLD